MRMLLLTRNKMLRGLTATLCLALAVGIVACSGNKDKNDDRNQLAADSCLSLPVVPDSVPQEEKLAYVIRHFWDEYEGGSPQSLDTAFMEQSFSNFIAILPYSTKDEAARSIKELASKSAAHESSARLLANIADDYLNHPNSPMRSEEIYLLFLHEFAENEALPEDVRVRGEMMLEEVMKNRPGMKAADFRIVLADGKRTTLRRAVAKDTTAVIFYDPNCDQCNRLKERLRREPQLIRYRILAIDVMGDRKRWEETRDTMPSGWKAAHALEPVDSLYCLPALPSIYLLAPDATVLLKDATL